MNTLTLIFLVLSAVFALVMYLQAYGWNWAQWQCILFGLGCGLAALLVLLACKGVVMKLVGKLVTLAHTLTDLI